jgi:glucose/arabinose dehydrogenase
MKRIIQTLYLAAALCAVNGSSSGAPAGSEEGIGPNPALPPPQQSLIPTNKVAKVVRWAAGAAPRAAAGFTVSRYAEGLDHPRWLYVLPNGDVLVAESSTKPGKAGGIRAYFQGKLQKKAGAVEDQSPDKIYLLRDSNGDGVVDAKSVFIGSGLDQPFGMALVGHDLYVANTAAVVKYPYSDGATSIGAAPVTVLKLPYWPPDNHHWTRSLAASADGTKLFVSVGSASNVGEKGPGPEVGRAAIHELDLKTGADRIFASGLRNPNGLTFNPETGQLWCVVNERDELGDELVPDYMTHVQDGAFYGWPYSYYGQHRDPRITGSDQRPDLVARAIPPDYALGSHVAALGLVFYTANAFPAHYQNGAFIGEHGSWNRARFSGYEVVFVPFSNGMPSGPPEPFLTGFLSTSEEAQGRPVGVAIDRTGALLVADDVGNIVWRVAAAR